MPDDNTQEIINVERRFWDAMRAKDGKTAGAMTDDPSIVVGAQGVSAIKPMAMEKMTNEGKWTLESYRFDEASMQVRFLDANTAITGYHVSEQIVMEGKHLTVEANDASVWVRRNGNWVCALHTESLVGDPFGRDKAKA
jgi:hypothetical protein